VIEVVAHRGAGQRHVLPHAPPENTAEAFAWAWAAGARAAECDVHLTRDGAVVAFHDRTTRRTSDGDRTVRDSTLAELRALDVGAWKGFPGLRVPLLSDLISNAPDDRRLYIELKFPPAIVPPLAAVLRGVDPSRFPLITFGLDTAAAAKEALPEHDVLLLLEFVPDYPAGRWTAHAHEGPDWAPVVLPGDVDSVLRLVRERDLDGVDSSFALPPSLPRRLADEGLGCAVWTVNDAAMARDLVDLGVRVITTDDEPGMRAALVGSCVDC
jgi:glycerophosphoryl diester phosphodiesterase